MKWKDTTPYRRGQRGCVEPWEWLLIDAPSTLSVFFVHGEWFVTCKSLGLQRLLVATTGDGAKAEAIRIVKEHLDGLVKGWTRCLEE